VPVTARRGFFEARGVPELRIEGSGREDAGRLVRQTSGVELAPAVVTRLVEATGGNPLALIEIPPLLHERQRAGLEPLEDPLRAGVAVEHAFGARIAALSPSARRALLVAAVSNTDGLSAIVAAAAGDSAGLDEAEAAGLISAEGERVGFRHPLVRSAVVGAAPAGERRAAHASLADALDGLDADRAAWHRALATLGHDERVAAELVRVAEGARRRGGAEAQARLLERAAMLTPDRERRAERLHDGGRAAYHAGRADYGRRAIGPGAFACRRRAVARRRCRGPHRGRARQG